MPRLIRSLLQYIADLDVRIVYIPGGDNEIADYFSRLGIGVDQVEAIHDVGHIGVASVSEREAETPVLAEPMGVEKATQIARQQCQ